MSPEDCRLAFTYAAAQATWPYNALTGQVPWIPFGEVDLAHKADSPHKRASVYLSSAWMVKGSYRDQRRRAQVLCGLGLPTEAATGTDWMVYQPRSR